MDSVHVVAAAIEDQSGRVLVTRRADTSHQGGLWEFPGGKIERGESPLKALGRELKEEIGIDVVDTEPLIKINHRYADRCVLLDVRRVTRYTGWPRGLEAQPLRWLLPEEMPDREFPAADRPVIRALRLPDSYLITGDNPDEPGEFLKRLAGSLESGVRIVQLRAHGLDFRPYRRLAEQALEVCRSKGARLLVNRPVSQLETWIADGLHLTSRELMALDHRPVGEDKLLGVSCHDASELLQAAKIQADFAVLSPVKSTTSHPQNPPMGWDRFETLVNQAVMPVYALGGMTLADRVEAKHRGGQGIAGISGLWQK